MQEKNIQLQKRDKDYSLSEMSIEEFQRFASIYLGVERARLEPFIEVAKNVQGEIMRKEGVLYYVQSLSARGVSYDVNNVEVAADLRVGINIMGEEYFLSDPTYYLIVNDFACDALEIENMAWAGGGVKLEDNKVYVVGWKAMRY
nr:hypothetical protein [uncultured Draconibacterium sp.]